MLHRIRSGACRRRRRGTSWPPFVVFLAENSLRKEAFKCAPAADRKCHPRRALEKIQGRIINGVAWHPHFTPVSVSERGELTARSPVAIDTGSAPARWSA